jgi:DNA-binding SARP family transcriptional activator
MLWPDASAQVSRRYLRQALWQLQSAIREQEQADQERVLMIGDHALGVRAGGQCWLDVEVFERAWASAQGLHGEQLSYEQSQVLSEAVRLYRGDLLEGWYYDWCLCERERLQAIFLTMLDKLMARAEASSEYEKGLDYGEKILRFDRARERTYQRMMRLQCLAGDRAGALRQFERCSVALDQELGVRPSKQTLEIFDQIRIDRLGSMVQRTAVPTLPHNGGQAEIQSESRSPLTRLRRLHHLLTNIERTIREDIQSIDRAIRESRTTPAELNPREPTETRD